MQSLTRCIGITPAGECTERKNPPTDHGPSAKAHKVSTAPTAGTSSRRKARKYPDSCAVDKRAVLVVAVGNGPLAVDKPRHVSTTRKSCK
jgi:hypothetical protein